MVIETLRQEDVLQAVALQQQIVPYPIDPAAAVEAYRTILLNPDCRVLIAREGNALIGTVSGFRCRGLAGDFLVIEDLVVREELRGSGIGTKLMAAIDDFGREQGCGYAILVSSGFRKRAHRFYEKIGYAEDVRGFRKEL